HGLVHEHEVFRLVRERERLLGLHLSARNVDATAVHLHVAVRDELTCLSLAERPSESQDHGIEARLELAAHLLAGDPGAAARLLVVAAHLPLAHAVDRAELLLLEQADLVLGEPLAAPSVLSGRVRSLDSRAVRPPAEGLPD